MNNISPKKTPINRPDIPNIKFSECIERTKHEKIDFKKSFNSWLDPKGISVITSSGKMAIHLLFKCLNLEGNVLTSPLSCAMTYAPIVATGTKLKFIDTDPHNFLINVNEIEDKISSGADGPPDYNDFQSIKMLDCLINETLRLYPSVAAIGRVCIRDYKIPGTDIKLKVGDELGVSVVGMHYNEKLYPNPKKWDPS